MNSKNTIKWALPIILKSVGPSDIHELIAVMGRNTQDLSFITINERDRTPIARI